jgi:hypothetical protein
MWIFARHWVPFSLLALGALAVFNSMTLYWKPPKRIKPTITWRIRAGLLGVAAMSVGIFLLLKTGF